MMNIEMDDWMRTIEKDERDERNETVEDDEEDEMDEDDEQKDYEEVVPFEEELVRSFEMLFDLVERGIEPSLQEFSEMNLI